MATYQTEAMILRRSNFGEADRLVTVFSDRYGKIRAVAKGIRRPAAKMAGSLELFSKTHLRLAQGKNLDIIVESNPSQLWPGIRDNLDRIHLASYLCELIDKTTQESESHPSIYRLLVESLEFIDRADYVSNQLIADYFRLRLMRELGYEPMLDRCSVGHEKLEPGGNSWSSSAGGLVCDDHSKQADRAVPIQDNTVKMMRLMLNRLPAQAGGLAQIAQIEVPDDVKNQAHRIIDDFFDYHFDIILKSKKYVELA